MEPEVSGRLSYITLPCISYFYCFRCKHPTFADCVATLHDYLTEYHAMGQKVMELHGLEVLTPELLEVVANKCMEAFHAFTCYVISTSYPKLHMQNKHSLTDHYFDSLCSITESALKSALLTMEITTNHSTRRDIPLCDTLLGSNGVFDILTSYIHIQFPDLPSEFNFNILRSAFEEFSTLCNSKVANLSQCPSTYNNDSVMEFHYLLLTVLA